LSFVYFACFSVGDNNQKIVGVAAVRVRSVTARFSPRCWRQHRGFNLSIIRKKKKREARDAMVTIITEGFAPTTKAQENIRKATMTDSDDSNSANNNTSLTEPLLSGAQAKPGEANDTPSSSSLARDSPGDSQNHLARGEDESPLQASAPPSNSNNVLLGLCTLTLVLVGIGVVLSIAGFPLWVYLLLLVLPVPAVSELEESWRWQGLVLALIVTFLHCAGLWKSPTYLRIFRTMVLPIRRFLFPLVIVIARIESVREQEPTLYYKVPAAEESAAAGPSSSSSSVNMISFRKSVRRHYRRMQKIYQRHNIQHQCVHAETSLNLSHVVPILWEHQKRICNSSGSEEQETKKNPVEEFIKRFLVITLVPDGLLDLYYNPHNKLVSLQFSVLQGSVWHWFMYFCLEEASKTGIWWHGALLAITRGHHHGNTIQWINAQIHQTDSKRNAGFKLACYQEDLEILSHIYPASYRSSFTRPIPQEIQTVRLWDNDNDNNHHQDGHNSEG
jgi:hypothetical protein